MVSVLQRLSNIYILFVSVAFIAKSEEISAESSNYFPNVPSNVRRDVSDSSIVLISKLDRKGERAYLNNKNSRIQRGFRFVYRRISRTKNV